MTDIDDVMWLSGDEDGGVCLNCRVCDRGGLPVAYYVRFSGGSLAYALDPRVEKLARIVDIYTAAIRHVAVTHP